MERRTRVKGTTFQSRSLALTLLFIGSMNFSTSRAESFPVVSAPNTTTGAPLASRPSTDNRKLLIAQRRGPSKSAPRQAAPRQAPAGAPYPEFRSSSGVVRWLNEQMPLKVYISRGLSLDGFIDPELGVPRTNTSHTEKWPDLVAEVVADEETVKKLPLAEGYAAEHYQAVEQAINSWRPYGAGLFNFQLTEDAGDADIYVFFTDHFVDKSGMGLFANDIRGYTSKRSFRFQDVVSFVQNGKPHIPFVPVVILLRTTDSAHNPMPLNKMYASAAHEFGHALGIEGHSKNPADLMSIYYGRGVISPNDAATIKYLYHLQPDLVP